jgi:hypothetical protein
VAAIRLSISDRYRNSRSRRLEKGVLSGGVENGLDTSANTSHYACRLIISTSEHLG